MKLNSIKNKIMQKGFTLMELIVVIAIIGLLSAIVLVSLTSAKSRGSDVAVRSSLASMRSQAEIYYSNAKNYGTAVAVPLGTPANCGDGSTLINNLFGTSTSVAGSPSSLISDVATKSASTRGLTGPVCVTSGSPISSWAVIASTSVAGTDWCVDSFGNSRAESGAGELVNGLCK